MSQKYILPYTIPSTSMDDSLRFTCFGMLSAVQEVTSVHYASGGLSIPHLQKMGITWVLAKQRFEISEYPLWMDTILLNTWAKPAKGPFFFRDYEFSFAPNGKKPSLDQAFMDFANKTQVNEQSIKTNQAFLKGTSSWIILDTKTLSPIRPSQNVMGTLQLCSDLALDSTFSKIHIPENKEAYLEYEFEPTVLDIDVNDHVNNLSYTRWILSYLPKKYHQGLLIQNLETYFISSALFNQKLIIRVYEIAENNLVHSIIRKDDGTEVFRAQSQWNKADLLARNYVLE